MSNDGYEGVTVPDGSGDYAAAMAGPHATRNELSHVTATADLICGRTAITDGPPLADRVNAQIDFDASKHRECADEARELRDRLRTSIAESAALRTVVRGLKSELVRHITADNYLTLCREIGLDPSLGSTEVQPAEPDIDHADTLKDRVNRARRVTR